MASTSTKFRFVRCPKCRRLLMEYTDVPVYQCGGCNTSLRAKNQSSDGDGVASGSLEAVHTRNLSGNGSSDDGTTASSVKQAISCSSGGHSSELERVGAQTILPDIDPSRSKAELNHHSKGESSESGCEIGIQKRASDARLLPFRSKENFSAQDQPDEAIHKNTDYCSNDVEESLKLGQEDPDRLKVCNKESPESRRHSSVATEEDMIDRAPSDGPDDSLRSPNARSSHTYDGSMSSSDDGRNYRSRECYLRLSRRTFRQKKVLDAEQEVSRQNKVATEVEAELQARTLSSKPSNKRYGLRGMRSSNASRGRFSSRYDKFEQEGGALFDSEDFQSAQNWKELESDGPSRSLLRDSALIGDLLSNMSSYYKDHDRDELLRKVDELREQLSELCEQRVEGKRSRLRGTHHLQQLHNHESEQHQSPLYLNSNLSHHPPTGLRNMKQQYQCLDIPLSGRSNCSCFHCRLEEQQLQSLPRFCSDEVCQACTYGICFYHSKAASPNLVDHGTENLHRKERRKPIKHHCRPISGGAPFVVCYNCLQLLQVPTDFLISRRKLHKLQCGACSEVLKLPFPAGAGQIPQTPTGAVHSPSKVEDTRDFSGSSSNNCRQVDPFSFCRDFGLSSSRTYSTNPEEPNVSTDSSEMGNYKQEPGSSLHQLMGYYSASDLLYHRADHDEGYESVESMVPHAYRRSKENHAATN